jgi:hypothetical protein
MDGDGFASRAVGVLLLLLGCLASAMAEPPPFVSVRLTPIGEYGVRTRAVPNHTLSSNGV